MTPKIDLSLLSKKKLKLEEIRAQLKTEFFGIDYVIDQIISSVNTWYLLPESLKSPVIISLFGITGVGKTSLIRSLTQKLGFSNKYAEIQMEPTNSGTNYSTNTSVCKSLEASNILEGEPGILLLDEIQRFRTVGQSGEDVNVEKFQDVWMLLSDGRFSMDNSYYTELENEIAYDSYNEEQEKATGTPVKKKISKKEKEKEKFYNRLTPWQAKMYKKLLRLKESLRDIMGMDKSYIIELCKSVMANRNSTTIDYSKLLIFIAGNLDEAFGIARNTNDCDTDADTYYDLTKKVTMLDVKSVLRRRFKPEQIARFGNNFVIYPSLNKKAYQTIIHNSCGKYIEFIKGSLSLDFSLDQSVFDVIYENSVFPAQGTRPVFSSIHKIFSAIVPDFALWSIENKVKKATIKLDNKKYQANLVDDKKVIKSLPITLDIQSIKADNSEDFKTMVAVHEIGHALAHALLFGMAPTEVKNNIASFKGGYNIFSAEEMDCKKEMVQTISVLMAGTVAEEIIFGDENKSSGCGADIRAATITASKYIRDLGFGKNIVQISNQEPFLYNNLDSSDVAIEKLISQCKKSVKKLLLKHKKLLVSLTQELLKKESFVDTEFIDLCGKYGLTVKKSGSDVNIQYSQLFKNQKNVK